MPVHPSLTFNPGFDQNTGYFTPPAFPQGVGLPPGVLEEFSQPGRYENLVFNQLNVPDVLKSELEAGLDLAKVRRDVEISRLQDMEQDIQRARDLMDAEIAYRNQQALPPPLRISDVINAAALTTNMREKDAFLNKARELMGMPPSALSNFTSGDFTPEQEEQINRIMMSTGASREVAEQLMSSQGEEISRPKEFARIVARSGAGGGAYVGTREALTGAAKRRGVGLVPRVSKLTGKVRQALPPSPLRMGVTAASLAAAVGTERGIAGIVDPKDKMAMALYKESPVLAILAELSGVSLGAKGIRKVGTALARTKGAQKAASTLDKLFFPKKVAKGKELAERTAEISKMAERVRAGERFLSPVEEMLKQPTLTIQPKLGPLIKPTTGFSTPKGVPVQSPMNIRGIKGRYAPSLLPLAGLSDDEVMDALNQLLASQGQLQ